MREGGEKEERGEKEGGREKERDIFKGKLKFKF